MRSALRDDQRIEPQDKGEGRHHDRAEPEPRAFDRALEQRLALFAFLLRELHDQDCVLRRKPDEHHHADLRIKIERQPAEQNRGEGPEHAHRHRKQNRHGDDPAFIQRDEEQIGEQECKTEDDARLAFGALLLERRVRPFAREALRQRLGGNLLHRGQGLAR